VGVSEEQHRIIVDGLAVTAVALAERHEREATALVYLRDLAEQMGVCNVRAFREAATAITRMPQPPLESAEETELALEMRTTLGVFSAEDQLAAALLGREWLTRLADDLEGRA